MRSARLTAHGELVDHLAPERAAGRFVVDFELVVGLRDLVQSCGIPHVEVGRATVDGAVADWQERIDDGADIELWARYPATASEPDVRFLLDVHLGKLARLLRLLGFDTSYATDADDDRLASMAAAEDRVLLSRDRGLLMRSVVPRGRWIRATDPESQAKEVVDAFHLGDQTDPFTRCMTCNGLLEPADPVSSEVPAGVFRRHSEYQQCGQCHQVYWPGSHHAGLEKTVHRIVASADGPG